MIRYATFALLLLASGFLAGCNSRPDWESPTYPTSGTISINGEAPKDLFVIFRSIEGDVDSRGSMPWGIVQEDGSYQMRTYDVCDGAPAGEYAILLRWPFDRAAPGDRLRSAFSTVDKSPLTYTVHSGKNQIPPIELTGVKVTPLEKGKPSPM